MTIVNYRRIDFTQSPPYDTEHAHYAVVRIEDNSKPWSECEVVKDFGLLSRSDKDAVKEAGRQAAKLARELNQKSFSENVADKTFTRYQTRRYVCIDETEMRRLASVDKTPLEEVRVTPGLNIRHATSGFTFWSDGKITKAVADLPPGGILTDAAIYLIKSAREADGGYVEGGIITLTNVKRVIEERVISVGDPRGHYARERVEELTVEWIDGSTGRLYIHTAGYFEGYQFDVYTSLEKLAVAQPAVGPDGITDFSEGFTYDPELGYVKDQE